MPKIHMSWYDYTLLVLVLIGAINWGLVAISPSYDLVQMLSMGITWLPRLIYGIVGLAGVGSIITLIYAHFK
jgi:uncharacterized protein